MRPTAGLQKHDARRRWLTATLFALAACQGSATESGGGFGDRALALSAVTVSDLTTSSANVNWTTNQTATSAVQYGLDASYGSATPLYGLTVTHRVQLVGLMPNALYHYAITSESTRGAIASSGDLTFVTLPVLAPGSGSTDSGGGPDAGTARGGNDAGGQPVVAPTLTQEPSDQTVTAGQSATFSVTASGTGPLLYQWQRGQADIAGATASSYTTAPTSSADNGAQYRCTVSNSAGQATSSPATLTVVAPSASGCSGTGTAWSCAAGSTDSEVQAVIDSSPDGTIIQFAPGAYTWSNEIQFSMTHGASLVCQTPGTCVVNVSGTALGMSSLSGHLDFLYRISGFTFNESSASFVVWFDTTYPGGSGTLSRVRVDHNTFNVPGAGAVAVFFGDVSAVNANYYGVLDHNTLNSPGSATLVYWIGGGETTPPPSPIGTANNLFVEDNVVNDQAMTNAGQGCTDSWGGASLVVRHNTFYNCLVATHGSLHAGGPQNWEFYGNKVILSDASTVSQGVGDCYRCFHHQGSGEFIAFDNSLTPYPGAGHNSDAIAMMYYRDESSVAASESGTVCDGSNTTIFFDGRGDENRQPASTYAGYACWHQPARDFQGNLVPIYAWGNSWSDTGSPVDFTFENYGGYYAQHWVEDRDYYNAQGAVQSSPTSPFNGSAGVGYGLVKNRPSTCSTGKTDPADQGRGGVGYFATDVGAQGTLYQCSQTNTWKAWYIPFTYPHPLTLQ